MKNYDILLEDFDQLFEESMETIMNEEISDTKVRKMSKALTTGFPYKELSKTKWFDKETIKAAGLDVGSMATWYKKYMKAYNEFHRLLTPQMLATVKSEEYLARAKAAKKELKSMHGKILGFEKQFVKGVKSAGDARGKADVAKSKAKYAEIAAKKKEAKAKEMADKKIALAAARKTSKDAFVGKVRKKVAKINFVTGK